MSELVLSLLLALLGALAWYFAWWTEERPLSLWLCGWGCLILSGVCGLLGGSISWLGPLMHLGAPALPALMLAGALAHANAPIPRWLAPATVALGTLRWGLAQAGLSAPAHALALPFEPAAELGAAFVAFRFARGSATSWAERLLVPGFVALAFVDGASAVAGIGAPSAAPPLLIGWAIVGSLVVGLQIRVALERMRVNWRQEQRVAEEALSDSQERYRALTEHAFDLIAETDAEGRITYANPRFEEVLGCPRGALIGSRFADRVHPEDRARAARWHRGLIASDSPPPVLARWRHQDGGPRWIESTGRGFLAADGALRVVVCSCDVTERMQMEEALRRAKAEQERRRLEAHLRETQRLESLGVLAGRIAHDFNNLLTVILGNVSSAKHDLDPDSPASTRLTRVQSAVQHATGLVDQMLTYSGKASLRSKPLQLSRLVEEILELLEVSISKGATLETDLPEHLPVVRGDETQIRQVVVNLISNASEALGRHRGSIAIRTGVCKADRVYLADAFGTPEPAEGEYVYLEVTDSGSGIDEVTRARIFEPFFTTKASGRGLGLAAVLGIVQAHKGAIKVTSEPGRGTTFRVLLPCAEPVTAGGAGARETSERADGGGTLLVVDDEEGVLDLAAELLQRAGFGVVVASSGRQAVEIFHARSAEIDAVVLDLIMPDVDGEETLGELQGIRSNVPVLLVSGHVDGRTSERLAARGVAGFVRKPYEPEALVLSVRRALARAESAPR